MNTDSDLTGKILIAMPEMGDPRFQRSVVLICAHSDEGAMGIVLNQPMRNMAFPKLLDMLGIEVTGTAPNLPIRTGGPVEPVRGFVLHPQQHATGDGSMDVGSGLALTTTRDILVDLAEGRGPAQAILALGYAGWGAGQLDEEMTGNAWFATPGNDSLLFDTAVERRWSAGFATAGVDVRLLAPEIGHA